MIPVVQYVVEYLILTVLFHYFIIYTCLITLCGHKIEQIRSVLDVVYNIWKKNGKKSFELSKPALSSEVPDVTFNCKEYLEPLVAFTDSIM